MLKALRRVFRRFVGDRRSGADRSRFAHSTIGERTVVAPGSHLKRSSVGADCRIGTNVLISKASVGSHVVVEFGSCVYDSSISDFCTLYAYSVLASSVLGNYSYLSRRALLSATRTGRFCSIAPNVICGAGDHPSTWLTTAPVFYSPFRQSGGVTFCDENTYPEMNAVEIGNDVWVGANAVIRNGIKIGNGAIVGAGSVVTKDVAPYAIVGGTPARLLRYRFPEDIISELESVRWWDFPEEVLRSNAHRWRTEDARAFLD